MGTPIHALSTCSQRSHCFFHRPVFSTGELCCNTARDFLFYSQVSRAPVSCAMNPCVNNGTCVDIIDDGNQPSYRCICPDLEPSADSGSSSDLPLVVGANCERLTACDTMPCGPHGTCVTISDSPRNRDSRAGGSVLSGYRCVCDAGFEGLDCSWPTNSVPRSGAVKQTGTSRDFSRGMMCICSCEFISLSISVFLAYCVA
jgi:hypothetical protein